MKNALITAVLAMLFLACSTDNGVTPPVVADPDPDTQPDPPVSEAPRSSPCVDGLAGNYPCNGLDLVGHLDLDALDAGAGNDIWGWTDPDTGTEYAVMGLDNGTAFIDISADPIRYLGKLPTHTFESVWRDVKVHADHAFIVSEASGHGMQVFDLKRLREVQDTPLTFTADAHYAGVGNAHNLVINSSSDRAYIVGTARDDAYNGGVHILDIADPQNPQLLGGYGEQGYSHDAQVITYDGPDPDYQGREILVGANETQLVVADVTDPLNPVTLANFSYPNLGYTHQGWFTEDRKYFILGDETDEIQFGLNSKTLVFDMSDLDLPFLHFTYTGPTAAIDHNGYAYQGLFYLANYTAGLRLLDLQQLDRGLLTEVAYFDTYPEGDETAFNGLWSVYPFFESGKLILGDIDSGLFVLTRSQ